VAQGFDDFLLTAGDLLRGGRASLGLTIEAAAKAKSIPAEVIFEIEAGLFLGQRSTEMMTQTVVEYASFLELNADEITNLYWQDVARSNEKQHQKHQKPAAAPQPPAGPKFLSLFRIFRTH
jgi:cytoskeletal protein RodZ